MKKPVHIGDEVLCAALRLAYDSRAATAVECGLIAGLIALAIVGALALIGSEIGNTMNTASNSVG